MKRIALAILALSLAVSPALAQPGKPAPRPVPEKPEAAPKKVKTLNIEAIDVKGDRVTGNLGPISVIEAAKSTSLIRIRRDFIDLIVKEGEKI